MSASESDTILIVDDEEPVRKTFRDWLGEANLGCQLLTAADAAAALSLADKHCIDLAVLDWNLGAGNDGLQLLEDLTLFNPDVVAIMVTGFANQATPLQAMRMGVRDYLDKNHELNAKTLVFAVQRQLSRIRPAKDARRITQGLATFRAAVEKVLPLVQSAAALNDPVPLPHAVRSLFRFLLTATGAREGVLLARGYDPDRHPAEVCRAYDTDGRAIQQPLAPFGSSIAGGVVSMQQPQALENLASMTGMELQPFERGRRNVLAAPLDVAPGTQVVLEIFDKHDRDGRPAAFDDADRQLARAAGEFAAELLRQGLAERQTNRLLSDAVSAALRAGDEAAASFNPVAPPEPDENTPADVMAQLQTSLAQSRASAIDAASTLRLAEAIRVLALSYGPRAVDHCTRLVEDLRGLLDEATGEAQP